MRPSQIRLIAAVSLVVLVTVACSAAASPTPSSPPSFAPGPTPSPTQSADASTGAVRLAVTLTDALRIEPADLHVPFGRPVTFVVTNTGVLAHEFFVGDEAAQAEHEAEMVAMGGMTHDEPDGIALDPGETKELTMTFAPDDAGALLAGCHVAGHYAAGMWVTIGVGR